MGDVTERLLGSEEPAVRYKVLTKVLGREPASVAVPREEIRVSLRVKRLLSERDEDGKIPFHPYAKWYGAHWVLASLADIGYPPGDESLVPLREQIYGWLFGRSHEEGALVVRGRVRTCASMEGNALYYLLALGLADARTEELAERLLRWQWPDGGWNCDKNPEAANSSFMESLIPLRALALHSRLRRNERSRAAAERAAEVFLGRRMYKSRGRKGHLGRLRAAALPLLLALRHPIWAQGYGRGGLRQGRALRGRPGSAGIEEAAGRRFPRRGEKLPAC